jgi:hypothetical protein
MSTLVVRQLAMTFPTLDTTDGRLPRLDGTTVDLDRMRPDDVAVLVRQIEALDEANAQAVAVGEERRTRFMVLVSHRAYRAARSQALWPACTVFVLAGKDGKEIVRHQLVQIEAHLARNQQICLDGIFFEIDRDGIFPL